MNGQPTGLDGQKRTQMITKWEFAMIHNALTAGVRQDWDGGNWGGNWGGNCGNWGWNWGWNRWGHWGRWNRWGRWGRWGGW